MTKYLLTIIGLILASQSVSAKTVDDVLSCKKISDCPYIFDVYDGDAAFKKALDKFKKLPVASKDDWIANGTASPSAPVILDGKTYAIFDVCKPHDCGDNGYSLAYDPEEKKLFGIRVFLLKGISTPIGDPSIEVIEMLTSYRDGELGKEVNAENSVLPVTFHPK